jgi:hypothetical protein
MRVAAPTTSQIRAVALVPAARTGRGHEEHRGPLVARQAKPAVETSAAFLAQVIAQELYPESLPPEASLADAYRPRPRDALEGLNFRAIA